MFSLSDINQIAVAILRVVFLLFQLFSAVVRLFFFLRQTFEIFRHFSLAPFAVLFCTINVIHSQTNSLLLNKTTTVLKQTRISSNFCGEIFPTLHEQYCSIQSNMSLNLHSDFGGKVCNRNIALRVHNQLSLSLSLTVFFQDLFKTKPNKLYQTFGGRLKEVKNSRTLVGSNGGGRLMEVKLDYKTVGFFSKSVEQRKGNVTRDDWK